MSDAADTLFPPEARSIFAAAYPERPHILHHALGEDIRLSLDSLADLAALLPGTSVEYNRGDVPIGVDGKPAANGMSLEETIRHIASSDSWAVLKNVEQQPEYRDLLHTLLEELLPAIEARTGEMLTPQGYVFISSPNAVTPYHFDPEHNILLQITGSKIMTQFPAGVARFAPDHVHESYHLGGPRELPWSDDLLAGGTEFAISPGQAVYVPVMAPHFVRNGPTSSISLSITWRSEWSYAEADSRCFNGTMRRVGLSPRAPGRWPRRNTAKSLAWRAMRRLGADS